MTVEITNDNFNEEVLQSDKPVLVDFWASWCGPCKMVSPLIDQISNERDDIKVGKVNVDEQPDLAQQFQVMSIPTIMAFKDGELVKRQVGAVPKEAILKMVD